MVDRISALAGFYRTGKFGILGEDQSAGVILEDVRDLVLHQIAAWPESVDAVGKLAAKAAGSKAAPGPCKAEVGSSASLLRIEPLKWWVVGAEAPDVDAEQGATLDISHSRTRIRVTGSQAVSFLNRHLPLDLREDSFPVGSVASSAIHHVGVTLWRSELGYELFIPRGFALSLWEGMVETATQFGLEVV
ncbi:MAG: sarcosine oxidase subunit gamma [Gammaproteobacteria bacterium]|nr:sarcosine oxidase subunit gamma [Gammaproteobacteria bacterium]